VLTVDAGASTEEGMLNVDVGATKVALELTIEGRVSLFAAGGIEIAAGVVRPDVWEVVEGISVPLTEEMPLS